jgi:hypothetical protein
MPTRLQMSLAAEERIREIEAKTAHEIQTVWHDRWGESSTWLTNWERGMGC